MPSTDAQPFVTFSRRSFLGAGIAAAVLPPFQPLHGRASTTEATHTWLLGSPDELRPPAPAQASPAEIGELLEFRDQRNQNTARLITRWSSGSAVLPWTDVILQLIKVHKPSPVRVGRALALLHIALSDAAVAVRDAKEAYQRPGPEGVEPDIQPLITANPWSFPSEHAAIAGAARPILSYLFPSEAAERIQELVDEAVTSRLWAGANFRSDIDAGLELGREIGDRAVARGRNDGSDAEWDETRRLTGEGY